MSRKPSKIYVWKELENLNEAFWGSMIGVQETLSAAYKKYTDEGYIDLKIEDNYEHNTVQHILKGRRLETDAEFKKRIAKLEKERDNKRKLKEQIKLDELATLNKLLKKYPDQKAK